MISIVQSLLDSDVAERLGFLLFRFTGKSEKSFMILVMLSTAPFGYAFCQKLHA